MDRVSWIQRIDWRVLALMIFNTAQLTAIGQIALMAGADRLLVEVAIAACASTNGIALAFAGLNIRKR